MEYAIVTVNNSRLLIRCAAVLALLLQFGCQSTLAPLVPASHVDLERLNRDWYVIANIPTFIERQAELMSLLSDQGYDLSKLRMVPQRWPGQGD